jgi:hypothetical protein
MKDSMKENFIEDITYTFEHSSEQVDNTAVEDLYVVGRLSEIFHDRVHQIQTEQLQLGLNL